MLERRFLESSGKLQALWSHLEKEEQDNMLTIILSSEISNTSEIEGEYMSRDSLRSSLRKRLGLQSQGGQKKEQLFADVVVDVIRNTDRAVSALVLHKWNQHILQLSHPAEYRTDHMEIVSGAASKEHVHFIAPPANTVVTQMEAYLTQVNSLGVQNEQTSNIIADISLAHLHFLAIHPYDDGNGRVARLLSYQMILQAMDSSIPVCLSEIIAQRKKEYYDALEKTNKTLEVTDWILLFGDILIQAQERALEHITIALKKERFFATTGKELNKRQQKAVRKLYDAQGEFVGGLSSANYQAITKTSSASATRDLRDLVDKGILHSKGAKKYKRYYLAA